MFSIWGSLVSARRIIMAERGYKNCLFCSLSLMFLCGSFLGLHCFSLQCNNNNHKGISIQTSWIRVLFSAIFDLCYILQTVNIVLHGNLESLVGTITFIVDFLLSFTCVVIVTHNLLFCIKRRELFYMGLGYLTENELSFRIPNIFCGKNLRSLRIMVYGNIIFTVTSMMLQVTFSNYQKILVTFGYITTAVSVAIDFYVHHIVLKKKNDYLRKQLQMRLLYNNNLTEVLKNVQRLHFFVLESLGIYIRLSNITVLIGLFLSIAIATSYAYILIVSFIFKENVLNESQFIDVLLTLLICFGPMFQNLFVITNLGKVNDDILSFIYLYPISKLSPMEARQVEILVNMLIIQKPNIKPFDLLTVSKSLIASISGTIVTYLLVAIQFYVTLREDHQ